MKSTAYVAFQTPNFRRFVGMRLMTTLAIQIMSVSVGYLMYELTDSKLMLGYIGLTEAIPAIGVSLLAGHLVDKYNRKIILLLCLSALLGCAIALFSLVWKQTGVGTASLITGLFSVIFLTGIARGFLSPTNFALLPQLVEKEHWSNAISWNSSTWHVASITGLTLGGLLYGFVGVEWTFLIMCTLLAGALFFAMQISPQAPVAADFTEPALHRIKEGLRFVFSRKLILSAIALDLFAVLFGGVTAILPVFAKDILFTGPEGVGYLRAGMALGAILTGMVLAYRPLRTNAGRTMIWSVAAFGVCNLVFGLSSWFWLSFACLFFAGVFDEVSVFLRQSLVQRHTPPQLMGRVSSVNAIFVTSSNEIGAFESGLAASLLGTVPSVVFGGTMTVLVATITWWRSPELRQYHIKD